VTARQWLCALGVVVAACGRSSSPPAADPSRSGEESGPTVDAVRVVAQPLDVVQQLPGEIAPYLSVAIYARVAAFVEEVDVDRGSVVRRGDLLARLSAPELAKQRAEAQSKLVADQATFERLRVAARTPGAVASNDLESAEQTAKAERERVASLAALESYLVVRAPFDGEVTERNVHPGALVGGPAGSGTAPLFRLQQARRLRLTVGVPEALVGGVAEGAKTTFTLRAWPGEHFVGTIRRISRSVDVPTRTMAVEADVENRDGRIAPGMYAEVEWPVRRQGQSLLVPQSAVVQSTERTFVERVRDGRIERVPIERGIAVGTQVEVFGALEPGEVVLRRGAEDRAEGSRVEARIEGEGAADAPNAAGAASGMPR